MNPTILASLNEKDMKEMNMQWWILEYFDIVAKVVQADEINESSYKTHMHSNEIMYGNQHEEE